MKTPAAIDILLADCCVGEQADLPKNFSVDNPLTGKNVVFTGFTAVQKSTLHEIAERCGMRLQSTVCKSTEFLICGDNAGPAKLQKAREQGVEILSVAEFFGIIGGDCPEWAASAPTYDVERRMYINFFRQLPIEILREIYKQINCR